MDEQARDLNRAAREKLGAAADAGTPLPPSDADGLPPEPPELPFVRLPGPNWLLSTFSREIGAVCATNGVYLRDAIPCVINPATRQIEPLDVDCFRTYVEKQLICFKPRSDGEGNFKKIHETMPVEVARGCLRSHEFIRQQRQVHQLNPVPMPVMRADGRIELLKPGYDPESQVLTENK